MCVCVFVCLFANNFDPKKVLNSDEDDIDWAFDVSDDHYVSSICVSGVHHVDGVHHRDHLM